MKKWVFILLIFISFRGISQENQEDAPEYEIYSTPLCIGDKLIFGTKSIRFKEVISDSRCPKGVTCVWAGEVKVLVEFFQDGKLLGEKVISGKDFSLSTIFGKEISLSGFEVAPYPTIKDKIEPQEYTLNLRISEKIN